MKYSKKFIIIFISFLSLMLINLSYKNSFIPFRLKINYPNPHDYDFIINPEYETCKDSPLVVAYLFCKPDDFEARIVRRQTWADIKNFKDFKILFALGLSKNETINQKIKEESKIFNDIIQEDFMDAYHNLTKKLMMSLKWASIYCKSAQFFLRINDDVIVNTPHLIEFLKETKVKTPNLNKTILGYMVFDAPPDRSPGSKFYVSLEQYPHSIYDPYCSGNAYIFTNDMTGIFFNATLHLHAPPFSEWLEDVYVGMIAKRLNLNWMEIRHKATEYYDLNKNLSTIDKNNIVFLWSYNRNDLMYKGWDRFKPNTSNN